MDGEELFLFLLEAELLHYYNVIKARLKVNSVHQLMLCSEEDFEYASMSRMDIKRLRKAYRREYAKSTMDKLKKFLRDENNHNRTDINSFFSIPPKLLVDRSNIVTLEKIVDGNFCSTYEGVFTSGARKMHVALKNVNFHRMNKGFDHFLRQLSLMRFLSHENVAAMFGFFTSEKSQVDITVVAEFSPLKDLLSCLQDTALCALFQLSELYDFISQIAAGMEYLENLCIFHGNLCCSSIIVYSDRKVKVAECGLMMAVDVQPEYFCSSYSNGVCPVAWAAPEMVRSMSMTSKADVWSYGVTVWEILTYGQMPWKEIIDPCANPTSVCRSILATVESGQRLLKPQHCSRDFYDLLLNCWEIDPSSRLSFGEIAKTCPNVKPDLVQALCGPLQFLPGCLNYGKGDVITVLERDVGLTAPLPDMWLGCLRKEIGFFEFKNVARYTELKVVSLQSQATVSSSLSRRASRKMGSDLTISGPQNDLRHTGHVGYDGTRFTDVAFIGENFDRLPMKVTALPTHQTDTSTAQHVTTSVKCDLPLNATTNPPPPPPIPSVAHKEDGDVMGSISTSFSNSDFTLDLGPSLLDEIMGSLTGPATHVSNDTKISGPDLPPLSEVAQTPVPSDSDDKYKSTQPPSAMHTLVQDKASLQTKPLNSGLSDIPQQNTTTFSTFASDIGAQLDNAANEILYQTSKTAIAKSKPSPSLKTVVPVEIPRIDEKRAELLDRSHAPEKDTVQPPPPHSNNHLERPQLPGRLKKMSSSEERDIEDVGSYFREAAAKSAELNHSDKPDVTSSYSLRKRLSIKLGLSKTEEAERPSLTDRLSQNHSSEDPLDKNGEKAYEELISKPRVNGDVLPTSVSKPDKDAAVPLVNPTVDGVIPPMNAKKVSLPHSGTPYVNANASALHGKGDGNQIPVIRRSSFQRPGADADAGANPLRLLRGGGIGGPVVFANHSSRSATDPSYGRGQGRRISALKDYKLPDGRGFALVSKLKPDGSDMCRARPDMPPRRPDRSSSLVVHSQHNDPLEGPVVSGSTNGDWQYLQPVPQPEAQTTCSSITAPGDFPLVTRISDIKATADKMGYRNPNDTFWGTSLPQHLLSQFGLQHHINNGDEVDVLQKIFGRELSLSDCLEALNDCRWDVNQTVKYIKLKQMLALKLTDVERCKQALLRHDWDVQNAASSILTSPLGTTDAVDV